MIEGQRKPEELSWRRVGTSQGPKSGQVAGQHEARAQVQAEEFPASQEEEVEQLVGRLADNSADNLRAQEGAASSVPARLKGLLVALLARKKGECLEGWPI